MNASQLNDIIEIVVESKITGVIATNTTIARSGLRTSVQEVEEIGAGGLSGKPVFEKSNEVIQYLIEKSGNAFPIIGIGWYLVPFQQPVRLSFGNSPHNLVR